MNKHLISAAAAVALLASGATVAVAQDMANPSTAPAPNPGAVRDAPTYVMMAGASDLFEIQSSQLILQSTQNPKIRAFAQMMITDHTNTTQQVMAAAQASGMSPPPPQLTPDQTRMMQDLQAADGAARDRVYLDQQLNAHKMALTLHTAYAARGDKPALEAVARKAQPIIRRHLAEVTSLQTAAR